MFGKSATLLSNLMSTTGPITWAIFPIFFDIVKFIFVENELRLLRLQIY